MLGGLILAIAGATCYGSKLPSSNNPVKVDTSRYLNCLAGKYSLYHANNNDEVKFKPVKDALNSPIPEEERTFEKWFEENKDELIEIVTTPGTHVLKTEEFKNWKDDVINFFFEFDEVAAIDPGEEEIVIEVV